MSEGRCQSLGRTVGAIARTILDRRVLEPATAVTYLSRYGIAHLIESVQSGSTTREELVDYIQSPDVLDRQMKVQSAEAFLRDFIKVAEIIESSDANMAPLVDTIARAIVRSCDDEDPLLLPEEVQSLFMFSPAGDLYDGVLSRLTAEDFVRAHATLQTGSWLLVAFRFCASSRLRRKGSPEDLAEARRLLDLALTEIPDDGQSGTTEARLAREVSRIRYDAGYIDFLQGDVDGAIANFRQSSRSAADGNDPTGVWIGRSIELVVSNYSGRVPRWLVRAGLLEAREQFEEQVGLNPNAERWARNVSAHLFDIAYLEGDVDSASRIFERLTLDPWVRRFPWGDEKATQARMKILTGEWEDADALLVEHLADYLSGSGSAHREGLARDLVDLAIVKRQSGDTRQAEQLVQAAIASSESGANWPWTDHARELLEEWRLMA